VSDDERGGGKPPNNFDLTTPNLPPDFAERARGGAPSQPTGGGFDRTSINNPTPQQGMGSPPPPQNPPSNRFDLTSVNANTPYVEDSAQQQQQRTPYPQQSQQQQQPQYAPAPVARAPRRGVPWWGWVGAIVALLLLAVAAVALYFLLAPNAPFTLRVIGLPPGSKLYVDDVPSGVPQRDGTITKQGLRASEPHELRVTREGFADYKETIRGESGRVLEIRPDLVAVKVSLPPEIEYNGAMVLVSAGEFVMGDDVGLANERPAHRLSLPDYYIDKYEVTNEQYARFCKETGHPVPTDPSQIPNYFLNNPRSPVMGISFDDASAYATWAGKRLPTEEEWEKAASWDPKANQKRKWPWGDVEDSSRANVGSTQPVNVGQYVSGASAYNALDMAGNVVEWVDSTFAPYPGNSVMDKDYGKNLRVYRGGSFPFQLPEARTTYRLARASSYKTTPPDSSVIGFRCAVSANDPKLKARLQQTR
jgi:iron(II)-dependent oxidoreductase